MLPITAVSEQLLAPRWVQQMLPSFEDSCLYDNNSFKACIAEGWSMLVHAGQAIVGRCGACLLTCFFRAVKKRYPGYFFVGVPNLPKCRVPVSRRYRTLPECSVGY